MLNCSTNENTENISNDIINTILSYKYENIKTNYIIETSKQKNLIQNIQSTSKIDNIFLKLCLKILENVEIFNRYLDFNNNLDLFSFNNRYNQKSYLIQLSHLLGSYNKDINFENDIFKYGLITEKMIERYQQLRNIINVDIDAFNNKYFEEKEHYTYSKEEQKWIDNDWNINKELLNYVLNDLDPAYTLEEQISHIYIKLCFLLKYNDTYVTDELYSTEYNKEKLEKINISYPFVICSEFSKIICKIFNNQDPRLEARCIINNIGHEFVGILIKEKNIRIDLEAISQTKPNSMFNDLSRTKLGLSLHGIKYIADRENIFSSAFKKVYNDLIRKKKIQTENLIEKYKNITTEIKTTIDFNKNLNLFLTKMQEQNIIGNDLLCTFIHLTKNNYFGEINLAIIICNFNNNKERNIVIRHNDKYFILRSKEIELIHITIDELNKMIASHQIEYENENYTIKKFSTINKESQKKYYKN